MIKCGESRRYKQSINLHLQKMHSKFLVLILSMYLRSLSCDETSNCSNDKFNCGSIAYISYPFWGGTRSQECGRLGFELICDTNIPSLTISSLSYRVQQLDFSTNSLTVARQDLYDTTCPNLLRNTTIDSELFKYPPNSTDLNLNLYYNCTGDLATLRNTFSCGDETINLFSIADASSGPGTGITCSSNINVPVNSKDAQSLQNPSTSSINILRSALIAGFSIRWFNDSKQLTSPYCNTGAYSSCTGRSTATGGGGKNNLKGLSSIDQRGSVVYQTLDPSRPAFPCCYATTKSDAKPLTAPVLRPTSMPPVTTPAYAPRPGYGLPPAPSSAYPPRSRNNSQIHNEAGKKRAKEIAIVVALTVAAIIIVSFSIHCFLKRRHSGSGPNPKCKHDVEKFLLQHGSLAPKRYKYCELKKITRSFGDKLGEGGYGRVYKGMLHDGQSVAVKVLAKSNSSGDDFMNEVASISRTSHVNIVTLLGFCYEGNQRALVYEFMSNSSLDKFLNNLQSAGAMDLKKLYKIAVGIAKGLEYLHTGCTTRIVHFDIKPQNILLDEDLCPKISDFGLAKLCKKKQSIMSEMGTRGTPGYIAPEVMFSRNFGGVSHKSDVYSYGMMLLTMAGAQKVVESEPEAIQSSEDYFPDKIYDQVISDVAYELEIEEEKETTTKMFLVGLWCIQTNPSTRPSISKVVEMLEGTLQSIEIPPKPSLFSS